MRVKIALIVKGTEIYPFWQIFAPTLQKAVETLETATSKPMDWTDLPSDDPLGIGYLGAESLAAQPSELERLRLSTKDKIRDRFAKASKRQTLVLPDYIRATLQVSSSQSVSERREHFQGPPFGARGRGAQVKGFPQFHRARPQFHLNFRPLPKRTPSAPSPRNVQSP